MATTANFRVDPRLAALLSENYRSSEQALKELVDNAWDADAENVWITLPDAMTDTGIVIQDDGLGMTEKEILHEYLAIASDRRLRKGSDRTFFKNRPVKGRKGIGKFAGFVAAEIMEVSTKSHSKHTSLRISKDSLLKSSRDLEDIDLPLAVLDCDKTEHGTDITLSHLSDKLSFPDPGKLRQLLVLEYGRERNFTISVNGEPLAHEDLPGQQFTQTIKLEGGGEAKLKYTLMDNPKAGRYGGIVVRVGGKVVGKPSYFGLDEREDIPKKLLNRVVGEIEADGLADDVTSDWGAIIENSTMFEDLRKQVQNDVAGNVGEVFKQEVSLAKARRQKEINQRLAKLPEYRREFAERALESAMRKFYGEAEDKIDTLVSLVLDAFDRDDYFAVCQKLDQARYGDVATFAEALEGFGLLDMAVMAQQAVRRVQFLDALDLLVAKSETLEKDMHVALEKSLWVFGAEYSLMSSNETLATAILKYTNEEFTGDRAKKRPDLFLAQNVLRQYLLIEFKRPSHTLNRDDENQAEKYRDDLAPRFGNIDILVVGGKVDVGMGGRHAPNIKMTCYADLVSTARTQFGFLVDELRRS
jgi:hypothetical protein